MSSRDTKYEHIEYLGVLKDQAGLLLNDERRRISNAFIHLPRAWIHTTGRVNRHPSLASSEGCRNQSMIIRWKARIKKFDNRPQMRKVIKVT